ncbi:hypothetical protein NYO67_4505 [Aspergillus flavus]|nr:hypothetical protein NYO67_4505 [Aspergillus flavus]
MPVGTVPSEYYGSEEIQYTFSEVPFRPHERLFQLEGNTIPQLSYFQETIGKHVQQQEKRHACRGSFNLILTSNASDAGGIFLSPRHGLNNFLVNKLISDGTNIGEDGIRILDLLSSFWGRIPFRKPAAEEILLAVEISKILLFLMILTGISARRASEGIATF